VNVPQTGPVTVPTFEEAVEAAEAMGIADLELSRLALAIGMRLGLDAEAVEELRLVALVHDVGKLTIPEQLLNKREPLTVVEWAVMQRHAMLGRRLIERSPSLERAAEGVGAVRERWDGTGYPLRLAGERIPQCARIVSVCAAYSAMRSGRPGRLPRTRAQALAELRDYAGTQFDPAVAAAACEILSAQDDWRNVAAAGSPDVPFGVVPPRGHVGLPAVRMRLRDR
jgi:HD-GYP domain-containing protein (c-di-GMP phosphodiesterase class II)